MKKERGITLIALIATIIVLLILASVSIAMLIGENGILTQAKRAKEETKEAEIEELTQIKGINEKLIRRHPHVFKDEHYETAEEVKVRWDKIKEEENKNKKMPESVLDKVPRNMPSLLQAEKLQKKASKYGFDWDNAEQVFDKLQEELNELKEAYLEQDKEHISEELGDVIFVLSRLASHLDISADESLRKVNNKFRLRFSYIEKALKNENKSLDDATIDEMEAKWQEAKSKGL